MRPAPGPIQALRIPAIRALRSPSDEACPTTSIPIDVEPQNPLGLQLRTKTEPSARLELTLRRDNDPHPNEARAASV